MNTKPVNFRLQKYKKNRIAGMNCYNAARAAGYSEATAKSHTKDLEKQCRMKDVLEQRGLTDKYLADKVLELIEAVDFISFEDESTGVDIRGNKPNWQARGKGLELALKLKDLLKEKVEHSGKIDGAEQRIIIIRDGNKIETKKEEQSVLNLKRADITDGSQIKDLAR